MPTARRNRIISPTGPMSLADMNRAGAVGLVPIDAGGHVIEGAGALEMVDGDPRDIEGEPPADDEQSSSDRVMELLGDVANDARAKVSIYRIMIGGKQAFCDELSPEEFEAGGVKLIRDRFGDGEFLVKVYGTIPGTNRFAIRARANITVDKQRAPVAPASGSTDALAEPLRQLAENQARMLEAITNRPVADPMANMTQMLSMMTAMRAAMGLDKPQEKRSTIGELADAMREMRDMKGLMEGEPADDSLTGMVKTVLPQIASMIGQQRQQPQSFHVIAPPPGIAIATAPTTDTQPQQPTIEGEDMGMRETMAAIVLKGYLAALFVLAEKGGSVEVGAELIAEKLPDELLDLMELPTWFEMLLQIEPKAAAHQAWLTAARDRALVLLEEPEEPEDTAAGDSEPPEVAPVVPVKKAPRKKA